MFSGPKTSTGVPLYADWAWDAGIGGKVSSPQGDVYNQGWRSWGIGAYEATAVNSIATGMIANNSSATVTPPQPMRTNGAEGAQFLLDLNLDTAMDRIRATSPAYPTTVWDSYNVAGASLSAFRQRGGKMIVVHGVSDPIFSIKDTIAWLGNVDKTEGGTSARFCRLFAVPGMNHCGGGPATDQFDAFAALVNWVEKGVAPESITATAGNGAPFPGRTRPLCVYPKFARYKGSGSLEDAANFACQ
jgi:feruloyl esterase